VQRRITCRNAMEEDPEQVEMFSDDLRNVSARTVGG